MSKIEIENLRFSYNGKDEVLKGLSLKIEKPSINVLLGLNGCGKTTLLKALVGILSVKNDAIFLCDQSIKGKRKRDLAKLVSFVPQLSTVDNDFPVIDYLLFGFVSELRFYELPTSSQMDKVCLAADKFEIFHLLDKRMSQISGGELQKVLICAAYLQQTPIIVLDEPLSALDLKNQALVVNLLKDLLNEGKTIVLSGHNPNIALALDAYVFLMKDGLVFDSGDASSIITKEKLTSIYGSNIVYSKEHSYDEISFK